MQSDLEWFRKRSVALTYVKYQFPIKTIFMNGIMTSAKSTLNTLTTLCSISNTFDKYLENC